MRFKEFLSDKQIYEAVLPVLLLDEDGPPVVPNLGIEPTPPNGGWAKGPFNPYGGGGRWFGELYASVKQFAVASRIADRLKKLGIKGTGVERVSKARDSALDSTRDLLMNPQKTAYRIPVWTTKSPPKPVIKVWNEVFAQEFARELGLITEEDIKNLAMRTAATFLETDVDDIEQTSRGLDTEVSENGKMIKRKAVNAADATWHVLHYKHRNKDYARVEGPEGNKMFQVKVKTGPAELT